MDLATIQAGGGGPLCAVARAALAALAVPYGVVARRRLAAYDPGRRTPTRLPVRVVCVGNLTAGGTGKTPFVAWLARRALAAGRRPAVLSRGYGPRPAGAALSDEGLVLRDLLGDGVVLHEDPDRVRGGRALLAVHPEVDLVLLDDGFQHRRLARDVDVVLLDATNPFGHGHGLPRGLLREPVEGLARAHVVVLTRTERATPEALDALDARVAALAPAARRARARTVPRALVRAADGADLPLRALAGTPVFAWAGIGNPRAFEALLEDLGARVVGRRFERDHRAIGPGDAEAVVREARACGAALVVVTRKDLVKLRAASAAGASAPAEVVTLDVDLDLGADADAVAAVLVGPRGGDVSSSPRRP